MRQVSYKPSDWDDYVVKNRPIEMQFCSCPVTSKNRLFMKRFPGQNRISLLRFLCVTPTIQFYLYISDIPTFNFASATEQQYENYHSLHHLIGLQRLSLHMCRMLEFIPSSIGSLTKLYDLGLTYCWSLQTLPSNIFKLKLTKLSFTKLQIADGLSKHLGTYTLFT
ncbi:hypothetical protein RJT34_21731 [Clitoria ternatea]|uniref:Uncharacterized protein n=1 Tax=Clitoria ternatea TaxID=43366 RepID=A0AAN9P6L5_CLITE